MTIRFTGTVVVPRPDEPIDRCIKRFLRRLREQDREVRRRGSFTKPSDARRRKRSLAAHRRAREDEP